jgi:uncharacterized protein (DUF924 family)
VLDETINTQFGELVRSAVTGGLQDWESDTMKRLALVILLDQFTRNVFRGQPEAFSGDARAQKLVRQWLDLNRDHEMPPVARAFTYMPLMHAENLVHQDECVRRFTQLQADAPAEVKKHIDGNLKSAVEHRDIIATFGRFPHRNKVLGRTPTEAETAFLTNGPRFGQ